MTEAEWMDSRVPRFMLELLEKNASQRKLKLFCLACINGSAIQDKRLWKGIEFAEAAIDGGANEKVRNKLKVELLDIYEEELDGDDERCNSMTLNVLHLIESRPHSIHDAASCSACAACWSAWNELDEWHPEIEEELEAEHAEILREIFGNPCRPITIDHRWLTARVIDLATAIYSEKAFDRMPILADALMDAGCDSEEILGHCRSDSPHVRGCFVVDAILGKE